MKTLINTSTARLLTIIFIVFGILFFSPILAAQENPRQADGPDDGLIERSQRDRGEGNQYDVYDCKGGGLSIPKCTKVGTSDVPVDPSSGDNPIMAWLIFFVNLFSVIIVAGAAIMIAVAGIQYTASRDNAQSTQAAKQRIFNVVIGLLMYVFFYGFMQWLIPGGVF